jgi:hypothetical protein
LACSDEGDALAGLDLTDPPMLDSGTLEVPFEPAEVAWRDGREQATRRLRVMGEHDELLRDGMPKPQRI